MVSSMVLLLVTAALLTLYVERLTEQGRLERGEQIGYALNVLGSGFEAYVNSHYAELASDQPKVAGVRNALEPTADELIRLLNIKGVANVPPVVAGASYRFKVHFPEGCLPSDRKADIPCRLTGLAYIDQPVSRGDNADYVALSRAVRVMKGHGGYSRPENPLHFAFPDGGAPSVPIPVSNPTKVAGVLAWRADTLPESKKYLKTSGRNRMNGTLRLDGKGGPHNLEGAKDISAAGKLTAQSLEIRGDTLVHGASTVIGNHTVNGNHSVSGNNVVAGNSKVRGNAVVNGELLVKGSGVTAEEILVNRHAKVKQDLTVKGSMTVRGDTTVDSLRFSKSYAPGDRCRQAGQIGMNFDEGLMFCTREGRWRLLRVEQLG